MEIKDNFLPYTQYQHLLGYIGDANYRYTDRDQVMIGKLNDTCLDFFPKEVNGRKYLRHQVNLYTPRALAVFHVDTNPHEQATTLIYYPCPTYDLDEGGTTEILIDNQIIGVRPICNRALLFDGSLQHRATPYRNYPRFSIGIKYV